MGRIVIDFLAISVVLTILVAMLGQVLPGVAQLGSLFGAGVAAFAAGHLHGRRTGAEADSGFAWRAALAMAAAMTVVLTGALLVSPARESLATSPMGYAVGAVVFGLVILLVARLVFRLGTRTGAGGPSG